jgi:4'-phosphopantetheinyl transferase EntD
MMEELVPREVVTVATRADLLPTELYPEERRALGSAVSRRRREFVTGRACARAALARIGVPPQAIASGRSGEPLWPSGVVGSITHCDGYRASAVARRTAVAAVGIDAEVHAALPPGVLATVAGERERSALAVNGLHWDRVLFSAKEAAFKAWFPLTGRRLAFEDAEVAIDREHGTFTVRIAGGEQLRGRWRVADGLVATAVVVGATAPAR